MRIIICGGRDFSEAKFIIKWLDEFVSESTIGTPKLVANGGCPSGADKWATYWAQIRGWPLAIFPANWKMHGKAGGPIRNRAMLLIKPDFVIAFPGGNGTQDMINAAAKMGIHTIKVKSSEATLSPE